MARCTSLMAGARVGGGPEGQTQARDAFTGAGTFAKARSNSGAQPGLEGMLTSSDNKNAK